MPPKKSGRPARPPSASRPAGARTDGAGGGKHPTSGAPSKPGTRGATARSASRAAAKVRAGGTSTRTGDRPSRRQPAGEVVLGSVPTASRVVGGFGVLGGLLLAGAVRLPHLAVGGEQVVLGDSIATTLASWIWPLVIIVAGVSVVRGHYPRLGLAALSVAAALSAADLVGELYWAGPDAARGRYEVIAGRRLLTSEIEPLAGWYVEVTGLAVLILVGLAVGWLWSQVVMDDNESLDPGRPLLSGLAAVCGVAAVLSLSATLVGIPDQVIVTQQPVAGELRPVESVVAVEGAIGLLDRPGLALTGGLLLSLVLVLFSVFATTLRPRLAVVGAFAAFTGYTFGLAVRGFVEAARSEQIEFSIGGWGLLVVAFGYAGLTLLAWRWRPSVRAVTRGLPMRAASRRALKKG